jgi:hypothetical protein
MVANNQRLSQAGAMDCRWGFALDIPNPRTSVVVVPAAVIVDNIADPATHWRLRKQAQAAESGAGTWMLSGKVSFEGSASRPACSAAASRHALRFKASEEAGTCFIDLTRADSSDHFERQSPCYYPTFVHRTRPGAQAEIHRTHAVPGPILSVVRRRTFSSVMHDGGKETLNRLKKR